MDEMNRANAATRVAIEFVTLWMEQDRMSAAAHIVEVLNDPNGPGAPRIIAGQCNLAILLVLMLAEVSGAVTDDDLQAKAREILQELARDLPE
jgi:hypothetical protein